MSVKQASMWIAVKGVAALLFAVTFCGGCVGADAPAHPELLVSTSWVADHLNDPNVVILQVGRGRGDYATEHIPGARFLSTEDFTTGHTGLMVELPPIDDLKQVFEDVGVSDNSRVVIYTSEWYPAAARAFFTLDYLGHTNAALLNGSMAEWKAEGRPLTSQVPTITKGKFTPHVHEAVRALLDDARAATQPGSKTLLVDSRPRKRYTAGHLPGADDVFWEETVVNPDKPLFLAPEQLRSLFDSRGIAPGHKLITYCEVGLQASHMYFVAKYLGYDVSMFDGSYYQWNEVEHLPIVKGSSPR
jgi:thiosulfate/3-mercaptopyruvate sulfurtransferase